MNRPRLFVSAVSSELRGARRLVADTLRRLGFDTVIEDDFPTGYGELRAWLEQQIDGCEGVFQLVGLAYGAEPPPCDDPVRPWPDPEWRPCSYTQFELLYALRRGKRTWFIEVEPGCTRDQQPDKLDLPHTREGAPPHPDPAAYQAERRARQHAYVERLRAANHLRHKAASDERIKNLVYELKDELAELRQRQARDRRRLGWSIGGLFAALLLVGAGILGYVHWNTEVIVKQTAAQQQITTERIRAHLLTAVEDAYQRDLTTAAAAADWETRERQREAAAAQRAQQRARIDDLAASFAAIEARGEAGSVFTELTRILQEQGVDPALAYVAAKRPAILEQVRARQAAARQRNRDDLQPLLTSAGLYAAKGDPASAAARYQEVLDLEPDWPEALAPAAWFYRDRADFEKDHGTLTAALPLARQALDAAGRLTARPPVAPAQERLLAAAQSQVADCLVLRGQAGDADQAVGFYRQALEVLERLLAAAPDSGPQFDQAARDVSVSLNQLGAFLAARGLPGDADQALAHYQRGLTLRERLLAATPDSAAKARDVVVSHAKLAAFGERTGDQALAERHNAACYAVLHRSIAASVTFDPPVMQVYEQLRSALGDPP
jgi:tetratricopeptide (TPR) repeat protein